MPGCPAHPPHHAVLQMDASINRIGEGEALPPGDVTLASLPQPQKATPPRRSTNDSLWIAPDARRRDVIPYSGASPRPPPGQPWLPPPSLGPRRRPDPSPLWPPLPRLWCHPTRRSTYITPTRSPLKPFLSEMEPSSFLTTSGDSRRRPRGRFRFIGSMSRPFVSGFRSRPAWFFQAPSGVLAPSALSRRPARTSADPGDSACVSREGAGLDLGADSPLDWSSESSNNAKSRWLVMAQDASVDDLGTFNV
ncbi:uncharacterized protein [Notamacropus eugenii]|uniref:uncharacterized protein n=1 Tax=Notamacropus eugenii TaxID=9315 RepID=UPI003B6783D9